MKAARRFLVIEIGRSAVRAVLFERGAAVFKGAREIEDSAGTALSALLSELPGGRPLSGGCGVYACIPAEELSMRVVEMPFEDRRKILEALPFEISGLLHAEPDDVVLDALPLGGGKVLAVAAGKAQVREYLNLLSAVGAEPCWLGSALFALHHLPGASGRGRLAVAVPGLFAAVEDGRPRLFKAAARLDNIGLGAAFLESEGFEVEEVLASGWETASLKAVFPGAKVTELAGVEPEWAGLYATAAMVEKGAFEGAIDFRKGEFEYTRERGAARRRLRYAAALAAVLAILAGVDVYLRYARLASEVEAYRAAARASYAELFPNERKAADPLYQLEARMKALEKEAAFVSEGGVLEALGAMASSAPDGVRLIEVTVAGPGIEAKGEAGSFQGATGLKEACLASGLFREASVSESKARAGGGTLFSISLKR